MYHVTQLTYIYAPLLAFTPSFSATYANQLIQLSYSVPRCGSRIFLEGWGVWGWGGGRGLILFFLLSIPLLFFIVLFSPLLSMGIQPCRGTRAPPPPGSVSTLDQPLSVPINAAFYYG